MLCLINVKKEVISGDSIEVILRGTLHLVLLVASDLNGC